MFCFSFSSIKMKYVIVVRFFFLILFWGGGGGGERISRSKSILRDPALSGGALTK